METTQTQTQAKGRGNASNTPDRKRMVALGIVALVAIWLVAFILSNSETVRVSFVFGHVSLSLIWVMIIAALLPFSKVGVTPKKRHISLILTGIVSALFVAVTILLNSLDWLVLPWLFISAFVLYCLPLADCHF